ncbi:MAG: nicotinate-nucleotide--dimethylbenzimidazole phosphoribosyltransferase [Spirochaetia bacterium]|nr:nicotinate-nucleotide--dimethylbenzimidazole phosphoribosyltransferase [Spirochaetia bacterium]
MEKSENNAPSRFSDSERSGVFRAIYERRDIRSFLPQPVPDDLLRKLLDAAHQAPSVGFMQPWNFIVVQDMDTRRSVYNNFRKVNESAALNYEDDLNVTYRALKLQGILDSPLNLLVTCDTKRGGPHVLGRATIPETDIYSTCLAIENFWLAARAEGIGVGWMSLHSPATMTEIFHLPEGVIPVAYLTVGYPVEFPDEPLLQSVGWRSRMNLDSVIFYETWGVTRDHESSLSEKQKPELSGLSLHNNISPTQNNYTPPEEAAKRIQNLAKPRNSLGDLENIILRLAAIQNRAFPEVHHKTLILMAGDHGISEEGVSAYKPEITTRMVYQFVAGGGAINAIARQNGINVHIVDMGVSHDFHNASGIIHLKIRRGSRNFTREAAMTMDETKNSIASGRLLVQRLSRPDILAVGEMGIGNSTSASALTASILGLTAEEVVGSGTGIGPETLRKKIEVVEKGLALHGNSGDPLQNLACFGGYEIAGLAGAILEACDLRIPVLLDGFITGVAALIACQLQPNVRHVLFAAHKSRELAHSIILEKLQLKPILDLGMALGEGSGAALAMNLLESASRIMAEMRTFEEAGIDDPLNLNAVK